MSRPRKIQSRETILNTALRLFGREGFHRVTMDRIAQELGVTKGTLYLYFRNKEELFLETLRHYVAQHIRLVQEARTAHSDPREAFRAALQDVGRFLRKRAHERLFRIESLPGAPGLLRKIKAEVFPLFRQVIEAFAEIIREGQEQGLFRTDLDPLKVALVTLSGLHALESWASQKLLASEEPLEEFLFALMLEGLERRVP